MKKSSGASRRCRASNLPRSAMRFRSIAIGPGASPPKGETYGPGQTPSVFVRVVSRGYFKTMGIPMRAGEDFTGREVRGKDPVMILNETAARRLWPNQNPIGRIASTNGADYRVIGVVGDVRHTSLEEGSGNEMYLAITSTGSPSADLVMRTTLDPSAMSSTIRAALRPVDPTLPTTDVRQMQQLVDHAVSPRRFIMWLLTAFAGQALILACLGIYGVVAYSVTERTREIGIRMALGASRGEVQRGVLRETLLLAAAGVTLGLLGALAAGRVIRTLLYDLSATDPATYVQMVVVLALVALARRLHPGASRVAHRPDGRVTSGLIAERRGRPGTRAALGTSNPRMPTKAVLDDADLAGRIAHKDQAAFEAFEALMRKHNGRLFRIARAILKDDADAEDALQDAYLDAYRHMDGFRGGSQLATWLTRIVINQALGRLRKQKRERVVVPFARRRSSKRKRSASGAA